MSQFVAINTCYGGFSLSERAVQMYAAYKGQPVDAVYSRDIPRDDHILLAISNQIGAAEASGRFAALKVVEIPDDVEWTVEEYDGNEWVAEIHRTWS